MITQNPIIGKARKKLAGVYARTLYGKNVVQSCPPSTKGHQTKGQLAVCNSFARLSRLSNQVTASLLMYIYYAAPVGRSRRAQWCQDLAKGQVKADGVWTFNPALIERLGGNPRVTEAAYVFTPNATRFQINVSDLSHVGNAVLDQAPCLILICPSENICISLLPYTHLEGEVLDVFPVSPTVVNKECWLFPLWWVNVGTLANPIMAYGSYQKSN